MMSRLLAYWETCAAFRLQLELNNICAFVKPDESLVRLCVVTHNINDKQIAMASLGDEMKAERAKTHSVGKRFWNMGSYLKHAHGTSML